MPSVHQETKQWERLQDRIKELERENASLRARSQPASKVRDLVLTALKMVQGDLSINAIADAQKTLDRTILALGEAIPGDVAHKKTSPEKHESGIKPYKPLDHGQRDNEAAAAQYRRQPR